MMKQTMKKTLGWLVVAAALTMGMAACSSDADSIVEPTIQEPAPTSLHITVGAGIANDNATTRAEVVDGTNSDNKPTHTLKFTTGDRLYFCRYVSGAGYLTGILTMDGEPSSDGLSATFSGDVKLYNGNNEEITGYDYSSIDNPLSGSKAYFIPSEAPDGLYDETNHMGFDFNESYSIASDVNTLMKTALYVKGDYDGTQQRFNLTKQFPILNCAIGSLTPNIAYTVNLMCAFNQSFYERNNIFSEFTYASMVTTDAFGNVRFAISGKKVILDDNLYWVLRLSNGTWTKDYVIGQKTFEPKIYNLTRDVTPFDYTIQAGTEQYIYNMFGLTEETWSSQSDYGLLKFKYMLCTSPGVFESNSPIRSIIINDGDGHIYTVTDTRDNGYGGILNFDTDFQFYVALQPISGKTLTITYDPHNNKNTYIGTIEGVTLAGGDVLNLGTVELMKTNLQ